LKITAHLSRREASLLLQLRTGHIALNKNLHQIGKSDSPKCPNCPNREETVHHLLIMCPACAMQRQELQRKLERDARSIRKLLSHQKAVSATVVKMTGRLKDMFGN
ncbi:hypothetical protein K439DRAFT_1330507, partial [Ramaria rubella]